MQKLGRANIMLICFTVMIIVNMAAVNAYSQQRTINYQGYLTDSTGPVNGPVMLILSIHDALSEGSQLWTETHPAVDVVDGIYNLQLGSIVWLNVDFNFPRFLQVAVDNGLTGVQVLSPRQQLLSVSHAINAEKSGLSDYAYNADKVDGRHASALDQSAHVADSSNPHGVSPASIGAAAASQFNQHAGSSANPHGVTAAQTGAAVLSDVTAAVTGHASDASAHHARYTDNEARAAVGSVIPSGFAILGDSDIPPAGYSYTGETMQSNGAGWKHEPDMSIWSPLLGVAASAGRIYVTGGSGHETAFNAYKPTTKSWIPHPPLPQPRWQHMSVVLSDKLYLMGGYVNSLESASVAVYDINSKSWSAGAPMNEARRNGQAVVMDGRIYVAGGLTSSGTLNTAEVYDPATGFWTMIAPMSATRHSFAMAGHNGKLYAFGGNVIGETSEMYDASTDAWTVLPPLFEGSRRNNLAAVTLGDAIYLMGGTIVTNKLTRVDIYYPNTETWVPVPDMMQGCNYSYSVTLLNKIFLLCASDAVDPHMNILDSYEPGNRFFLHRKD